MVAIASGAVLLGAVACAAKVDPPAEQQKVSTQELGTHHRHMHGPVNVIIQEARARADLTAEQAATLTTIQDELGRDRAGRKQLRDKLRKSAVAIVRSGSADSKQFDDSVATAVKAIEERMDRTADALEEIHGTLRPAQRAAVAAGLRARIEEKMGRKDQRHQGRFQQFASELMLSTAQVDALKRIHKELRGENKQLRPSREELLGLVDAFEGESFREALNAFRAKKRGILRDRVKDAGKRTDSVLAIFTPEQRELLADLILEGPRKVLLGEQQQRTAD